MHATPTSHAEAQREINRILQELEANRRRLREIDELLNSRFSPSLGYGDAHPRTRALIYRPKQEG